MSEPFHLIETMRFEDGIALLDRHMRRLEDSARFFDYRIDVGRVRSSVIETCSRLSALGLSFRLRLTLDHESRLEIAARLLPGLPPAPRRVRLSDTRIDADDVFRSHKTSKRDLYDTEYRAASSMGFFEVLYLNEAGYVAEGSRSNVFIQAEGEWLTPPLEDGALPGVRRSYELDTNAQALEARLNEHDLRAADKLFVCNAVIGMVEVQLIDSDSSIEK